VQQIVRQELQAHGVAGRGVVGSVDLAHPAPADQLAHPVPAGYELARGEPSVTRGPGGRHLTEQDAALRVALPDEPLDGFSGLRRPLAVGIGVGGR
jgi:hypothetical protein